MEKRPRFVHVTACSNTSTRIQLTISAETTDLRELISIALEKLASFNTDTEYYSIESIDSISYLHDMHDMDR